MSTRTIEAVLGLQHPKNLMELRPFLAICNMFRRLLRSFARVATPLNKKLREGKLPTFDGLSSEEIAALEMQKLKLLEPTVLALLRLQGHYTVETDACQKRVSCILLQ